MSSRILRLHILFSLALLAVLVGMTVRPAQADSPPLKDKPIPGEILLLVRPAVRVAALRPELEAAGLHVLREFPRGHLLRLRVPAGQEARWIARLSARSDVAFAGYNYPVYALTSPNDPNFFLQWGLHNTGQTGGTPDADIDAPEAWNIYTGGQNVTLAIIDTGIDLDHEDLQANLWTNSAEIPGNGLDDDGNGYVDDVYGYDFYNSDSDPTDDHGHGSHVAGIAGAVGNNGTGIAGVSWSTRLMALKILSSSGTGTLAGLVEAIYYAVDNGAQVINISAGGTCSATWNSLVQPALDEAAARDVLVVAASGNSNSAVFCPAAMNHVLAVGATNHYDTRWSWNSAQGSNFGPELDISAPGEYIYSTLNTGGYSYKTGTSMASPHAAGLAALLKSFDDTLFAADLTSLLQTTADDLTPPPSGGSDNCANAYPGYSGSTGWDPCFGYGRINAARALNALVSLQTSPRQTRLLLDDLTSTTATASVQLTSGAGQSLTWTAVISPVVSWLGLTPPASGQISAASSPEMLTLQATRPATYGVYSTTVVITGTAGSGEPLGSRTTEVVVSYVPKLQRYYLPLVVKNAVFLPDLVVESLIATSNAVTVTLKNQGLTAVTDAFWVDVYFNPDQPPQVNQPWPLVASAGAVWGVTDPLPAGAVLTLTTGGPYYFASLSSAPPLPAGAAVYALADSVNFTTTYGAVQEADEGNNRFGPVISTASVGGLSVPGDAPAAGRADLPDREIGD